MTVRPIVSVGVPVLRQKAKRISQFDKNLQNLVQDMIDTNFKFFKQINDKPEFAAFLNDLLFDRYAERKSGSPG